MLLSVGKIKKLYGISRHSLYSWEKQGLLKSYQTPGGKKLYRKDDLEALLGMGEQERQRGQAVCIYARVSTKKQVDYLQAQRERLRGYCRKKGYQVWEEISEVASGINENRAGLHKVINAAKKGRIVKIVIEYPDRLARFGYKYLERLFELCGVTIEVVNKVGDENESIQKELAEDLIAIVSSFSARVYESRGGRKKKDL